MISKIRIVTIAFGLLVSQHATSQITDFSQLTDAEIAALQALLINKTFTCQTAAKDIQGCWSVPLCVRFGETSYRKIIEFTSDGFFLRHHIQYKTTGCNSADIAYVTTQKPPEEWDLRYKPSERTVSQGQRSVTYQDIFFANSLEAMTGEAVGYKLKGNQICFLPSQLTEHNFITLDDGLLRKIPHENEYFFSGQHLEDMTVCFDREPL